MAESRDELVFPQEWFGVWDEARLAIAMGRGARQEGGLDEGTVLMLLAGSDAEVASLVEEWRKQDLAVSASLAELLWRGMEAAQLSDEQAKLYGMTASALADLVRTASGFAEGQDTNANGVRS